MKAFLQRFGAFVLGKLIGFDRWRFRGSKRRLCYPEGVMSFLSFHNVLLMEFNKPYAKDVTATLCAAIEKPAEVVVVIMQALATLDPHLQPFGGPVLTHPQVLARLGTTQHRDQTFGLLVLRGDRQGGWGGKPAMFQVIRTAATDRAPRWLGPRACPRS